MNYYLYVIQVLFQNLDKERIHYQKYYTNVIILYVLKCAKSTIPVP